MGACVACCGCGRCMKWVRELETKCARCGREIGRGVESCPYCGMVQAMPPGENAKVNLSFKNAEG